MSFNSFKLKSEIQQWVKENIISEEQAELLYAKYNLNSEPPWYRRSSFIISGVALSFAALGILLLISYNWWRLGRLLQTVVCITPLIFVYILGIWFLHKNKTDRAELSFFFACLLFFANMVLLAQIYHISAYFPDSFLWWAIGCLPFAFILKSNAIHLITQFAFGLWMYYQTSYYHISIFTFVLFGAMLYMLLAKPNSLLLATTLINLFLCLLNVMLYVQQSVQNSGWMCGLATIFLFLMAFLRCTKNSFNESFVQKTDDFLRFIILFIFYLSTWQDIAAELAKGYVSWFSIVIFVCSATVLWLKKAGYQSYLSMLFVFILLVFQIISFFADDNNLNTVVLILSNTANVIFLLYAAFNIFYGIHKKIKPTFMFGIFLLVVFALSRYLALFGDYITTAIIFILCSLGLFAINHYWTKKYESQK
ncbi:MAG: DUF2157 domain-containing protein [Cytophagaceae bacterium]|nr:DUF2157 domain-containing protein [Cytophagaceae bacterium]MDW8455833.1 DUF2157 domain-containing protein [Cytophagaceae bacterium]